MPYIWYKILIDNSIACNKPEFTYFTWLSLAGESFFGIQEAVHIISRHILQVLVAKG